MGFQLTIAEGKEAGRDFAFEQLNVAIGRSSECDVVLYDPGISRKHARIFAEGDAYLVEDLGSANGTKVNGALVKSHKLNDGDKIALGPVVFVYHALVMEAQTGEAEIADQSTRIVAAAKVTRPAAANASALVPVDASDGELQSMRRSPTRALPAAGRARSVGLATRDADEAQDDAVLAAPVREGGLTAAERARIRRQSPGLAGSFKLFWLDASAGTRRALVGATLLLVAGLVSGLYYLVLVEPSGPDLPPEPSVLSRDAISESFGLGDGVSYVRSDMKVFDFEFASPTQALVILTYQAKDIAQGEVAISANGQEIGSVPPDVMGSDDRVVELVIRPDVLKKGEKNQVIFDNVRNPPGKDDWRVWNLRVEAVPLPEVSTEQMVREAKTSFDRAVLSMERKDIGAANRYEAWREYRNSWLYLEGHPEPKPELYELARAKVREAQQELDRTCAKLMLEVETYYNQRNYAGARATLEHVNEYFPNPRDQLCPRKAEQKRYEYDL